MTLLVCVFSVGVAIKLIQLLQHFDHLANPIATIVSNIVKRNSFKTLVISIVQDIASKDPADLAMDASGTKTIANFLVVLSVEVPCALLPAVPVLLPHLGGESVTFRNCIFGVLGGLLRQLSKSKEEPQMSTETRDMMLEQLSNHLHDTHAFVRVKVLHILQQLSLDEVSEN